MVKFLKKSVFFIVVFYLVNFIVAAFLRIPINDLKENKQYYPELRWSDFFEHQENSIDMVFLGSSHCYRSFVPSVFDSALQVNSFNLGSASQTTETSFYIMKEVAFTQKPNIVIIELSWMNFIDNDILVGADNNQFSNRFYNLENFRNKKNQIDFVLNTFNHKDYVYLTLPAVRYRRNYVSAINSIMGKKKTKPNEYYFDKGFVKNINIVDSTAISSDNSLYLTSTFSKDLVIPSLEKSLDQLTSYLSEKNIEVLLVTAPIAPTTFELMENYDEAHNYFQDLANKYKLPYLDYNYINLDLKIIHDKHFKDDNHLNFNGAMILSQHLSQVLNKNHSVKNK